MTRHCSHLKNQHLYDNRLSISFFKKNFSKRGVRNCSNLVSISELLVAKIIETQSCPAYSKDNIGTLGTVSLVIYKLHKYLASQWKANKMSDPNRELSNFESQQRMVAGWYFIQVYVWHNPNLTLFKTLLPNRNHQCIGVYNEKKTQTWGPLTFSVFMLLDCQLEI